MHHQNYRNYDKDPKKPSELRINYQIRVLTVRVVRNEEQLGIMSTENARRLAEESNFDLVEVIPNANPPLCKIMDYAKYKYEKKVKDKDSAKKKRESQIQFKELRFRPSIAENDLMTKVNHAKKFLQEGCKIHCIVQFKGGRELNHIDNGFNLVKKLIDSLSEYSTVEVAPKFEGNKIFCCLASKV